MRLHATRSGDRHRHRRAFTLLRPEAAPRFRLRRGFTLIELLIVVAIIGLLVALGLYTVSAALCASRAGAAQATLQQLVSAISAYKTDFGDYPGAGAPLTADTTVFVKVLQTVTNRQGVPYLRLSPDVQGPGGELLSPFSEPYYYTMPGAPGPGPDGVAHPAPYYLWTPGCRLNDPGRRWEISNWGTGG